MSFRLGLKSCALWISLAFPLAFTLAFPHELAAQEGWNQFTAYVNPTCLADGGDDLWIGTSGGLVRLHKPTGRKTYFNLFNSGLTDTRIMSLAVDGAGTLWAGSEAGGLAAFDGKAWTRFDSTNSPLRKPGVALLARDTGMGIWILARSTGFGDSVPQLFHKKGNVWKAIVLPKPPVPPVGVLAGSEKWAGMGTDPSGRLWIESTWGYYGTSHLALLRVDELGNVSTLPPPRADGTRFSLVTGNGDILWFYSGFVIRQSGTSKDTLDFKEGYPAWIAEGSLLNKHWRTADGNEFLTHGGLWRLVDGRWDTASVPESLKGYDRRARVAGDGSGGAWFAYSDGSLFHLLPGGGILRDTLYSPLPSTFIQSLHPKPKSALPEAWVNTGSRLYSFRIPLAQGEASSVELATPLITGPTMAHDAEGGIWIDSENGPVRMGSEGVWRGPSEARAHLFPEPVFLPLYTSRSQFARDGAGTLWIADNFGLVGLPANPDAEGKRFDHPYLQVLKRRASEGRLDASVQGLAICGDGDRWISGYSQVREGGPGSFLSRLSGETWTHFDATDHPWLEYESRQLACDGAGRLWASMPQGLLQWDGETWKSFAASRSSPSHNVSIEMAVDAQGALWAAGLSIDTPLIRYAEPDWVVDAEAAVKLRNVSISSMEFDAAGRLWLGTDSHGLIVRGATAAGSGLAKPVRPASGAGRLSIAQAGGGSWRISVAGLLRPGSGTGIRLSIHDSRGRLAWRGGGGIPDASSPFWHWDGKDRNGMPLSPGRYYLSAASPSGAIGSLAFVHPGR